MKSLSKWPISFTKPKNLKNFLSSGCGGEESGVHPQSGIHPEGGVRFQDCGGPSPHLLRQLRQLRLPRLVVNAEQL